MPRRIFGVVEKAKIFLDQSVIRHSVDFAAECRIDPVDMTMVVEPGVVLKSA
jgi:hypothetical protein